MNNTLKYQVQTNPLLAVKTMISNGEIKYHANTSVIISDFISSLVRLRHNILISEPIIARVLKNIPPEANERWKGYCEKRFT